MNTAPPSPTAAEPSPWGRGRRCAILGSPVGHSLSPVLHRAAYSALGLDWVYERHEVGEDGLAGFLAGLDGTWRGLSLTMPLKRVASRLVDSLTDRARAAGAVNTLLLADGRRIGDNTDIPGAVDAVRERYAGPVGRAVVLGGGATATSVGLALVELGCREIELWVRSPERAAETVAALEAHPAAPDVAVRPLGGEPARADLVVSTVPAAAQDERMLERVSAVPVVFDVTYAPWPTPLAQSATASGRLVVGGHDLLLHQAARQVELMTGCASAPLAAMRAALASAAASSDSGPGHSPTHPQS